MIFRNAFQIMINNFGKVFKLLLYYLAVFLFLGAIYLAVLAPNISSFFNGLWESEVMDRLKDLGGAIIGVFLSNEGAEGKVIEGLAALGAAFAAYTDANSVSIGLVIAGTFLVILAFGFLKGIGEFVVGDMINTKMSSYAEINFIPALVRNIGPAAKFFVLYVPISTLLDLVTIAVCYFVFFFVLSFLPGFVALFFTITTVFCVQALKLAFTSDLMPCMIEGKMKIKDSLKYIFARRKYKFGRSYACYLVYVYAVVIVNVMTGLATLGSGLLLTLPLSMIWLLSIRFVNYYTSTGRKYFITYDTIVLNDDLGETEKFFENNEMYDKTKTR
ncbi:MAG: hypothetical protein J5993_01450 [Clostridia bacterium]|nr:hypothetical protein [Clostridia bacterium]